MGRAHQESVVFVAATTPTSATPEGETSYINNFLILLTKIQQYETRYKYKYDKKPKC